MATTKELLTKLYVAYFDRAPDPVGLEYWIGRVNDGMTIDEIAQSFSVQAETTAKYPYLINPNVASATTFITSIYQNLFNRVPDAEGLQYWMDELASGYPIGKFILAVTNGAVTSPDMDVVANKVAAGLHWVEAAANLAGFEYGVDEANSAAATLDLVTADPASVALANDAADQFFSANPGQTFLLTDGDDFIPGLVGSKGTTSNSGDDTIRAGNNSTGPAGNTLGSGDSINGGLGFDTLKIVNSVAALPILFPNLREVERVDIQSLAGTTQVDLTNALDVEQIWNDRSIGGVNVTNVQEEAVVGVHDTSSQTEVSFDNSVDFGGDLSVALDGAGTAVSPALILIAGAGVAGLTTLNVESKGSDSYVRLDVDTVPGAGGATAPFENLVITGDAGLRLRSGNPGDEFDGLTSVDATGLTGWLDLDLGNNDENIVFQGGSGDTTLVVGNGSSTITTGEGNDAVTLGFGLNVVETGAGDDTVDASNGGNQTIDLGAGDDTVLFDGSLTVLDAVEGGEGTDRISLDVAFAAAITATDAVDAVVNGFEQLVLTGQTLQTETNVIDLDNLDDISHVTIDDGTQAGVAPVNEVQEFHIDFGTASGGQLTVNILGTDVLVEIAAGATVTDVRDAVIAAVNAAAIPGVVGAVATVGQHFVIEFESTEGNIPNNAVTFTNNIGNESTLTLNPGLSFEGTTGAAESFTVALTAGTDAGGGTVAWTNTGVGTLNLDANQSQDEIGAAVMAQYAAAGGAALYNVAYNSATNVLTFTAKAVGDLADVAEANDTDVVAGAPVITQGIDNAQETQIYDLAITVAGGVTTSAGVIVIEGVQIAVPAGTTTDDLGALIANNQSAINTAVNTAYGATISSFAYNTGTNQLTIVYTAASGNVPTLTYDGDNNPDQNIFREYGVDGYEGIAGGEVILNNFASGGTVVLGAANLGLIDVNLTTQTAADSITVELTDAVDHDGILDIAGIESLTVVQKAVGAYTYLNLDAAGVEHVVLTGEGGVAFTASFDDLVSFDASALDADSHTEATSNSAEAITYTGGAGADNFSSGSNNDSINGGAGDDGLLGNDGNDTINGGEGADDLSGGTGIDILTGGAGSDIFYFDAVSHSQGAEVDTITDFTVGQDWIDLSVVEFNGHYTGEASGYGAVLTSLLSTGDTQAVLDTSTSTLYVDVDGNGLLDNADMAINLTGITDLDNSNFIW